MSASRPDAPHGKAEIKRGRRLARINVGTAIALAFGVLLGSNYCSSLLYACWGYDADAHVGLSSGTLDRLGHSQGRIQMTALFEQSHPFNDAVRRLLVGYREAASLVPGLQIETTLVNANHDLAAAAELFRRLPMDVNTILIEFGTEHRIISEHDMMHTAPGTGWSDTTSEKRRLLGFNGEQACTRAMTELLHPRKTTLCFVQGHGEYNPEDSHQITGASATAQTLSLNGYSVRSIDLPASGRIPDDCDILLVAGPRTPFTPREIEAVSAFLADGGNAMVLVDNADAGGLTSILAQWKLQLLPVPDSTRAPHPLSTRLYGEHPVTRPLEAIATFFSNPCRVDALADDQKGGKRADKPTTTPLILIPSGRHARTPRGERMHTPIAAASELGGARLTGRRFNTRLIVCGDSDFISNAMNQPGYSGNTIFLLAALEWLSGRPSAPITSAETLPVLQSGIDPLHGWTVLGVMLGAILPAAILLFGLLVYVPASRKL